MSYILEALADSEQTRQQNAAVPRYSLLPVVGEDPRRQRIWPYALAGALLANAVVLQVWLRPTLPGGALSTASTPAPVPLAVADARATPLARSEQALAAAADHVARDAAPPPEPAKDQGDARAPAPAEKMAQIATQHAANDSAAASPKAKPRRSAEAGVATAPTPVALAAKAKPIAASAVEPAASAKAVSTAAAIAKPTALTPAAIAATAKPIAIAAAAVPTPSAPTAAGGTELPAALQQELPAVIVAGFIRDEGSAGMVIVNDRLVREGDDVAPGVKLEKLAGDSLIFSYKGYRFKR